MVEIDPDITRASTLPSKYYTDPQLFETIISKFRSNWNFIGHASQSMGEFNCLSNVCTHRGMILQNKIECKKTLICPYHGRSFSLDGKFKNMPEFEKAKDFPSEKDNLHNFNLELWNDFIFISNESNSPLQDWLKVINKICK